MSPNGKKKQGVGTNQNGMIYHKSFPETGLGKFESEKHKRKKKEKIRLVELSDPYKYSDQWTNEVPSKMRNGNQESKKENKVTVSET